MVFKDQKLKFYFYKEQFEFIKDIQKKEGVSLSFVLRTMIEFILNNDIGVFFFEKRGKNGFGLKRRFSIYVRFSKQEREKIEEAASLLELSISSWGMGVVKFFLDEKERQNFLLEKIRKERFNF